MDFVSQHSNTIIGWTIILGATGGFWYVNQKKKEDGRPPFRARGQRPVPAAAEATPPQAKTERVRRAMNKKAKPAPATAAEPVSLADTNSEKEDTAWAQELAQRKLGTSFTTSSASTGSKKPKTVKQNKANKAAEAAELSTTSSTNGADGDDDLSPAQSPILPAEKSSALPNSKDVSDMLEAPSAGPAVIRLTESNKPAPKAKQAKGPIKEEGRRHQQNVKKAEEKKAAREEADRIQRDLLEKQRRLARINRNEPAKDGSASAKVSNGNIWQKGSNGANGNHTTSNNGGLLDTLAPETTGSKPAQARSNGANGSHDWWRGGNLPSEEEQERILKEQDDSSWNTVAPKKGKKAKNTNPAEQSAGQTKSSNPFHNPIEDDENSNSSNSADSVKAPSETDEERGIREDQRGSDNWTVQGDYRGKRSFSKEKWQTV
jgi:hypothetical protein